jgi:transcriptional regulator with XRE-family HTH domain
MLVRMSKRARTTVIALIAAVAVSSIAYGLGSQRGGGSAAALGSMSASDRDPGPFGVRHGPPLDDLADRLGVSADKLEAALEDIRGDRSAPDDHHAELAADLAAELGVAADRVTAALEKLRGEHGRHHEELTGELADKLGVDPAKLRAAFEKLHGELRHRGPRAAAAALARELGIDAANVRSAFRALRDELGPPPRRHHDHADIAADLADELGVSESAVRDAFEKLHEAKRKEFAAALAERLDVPAAKVEEALGSLPHHEKGGRP